jgi:predicted PurR-regulated permease PerM
LLSTFQQRRHLVEIARRIEHDLPRYLLTTTAINVALGTAVGLAFWRLGLPNPTLWGVVVALLNFVPYVGGAVGVALITLVSLATFPTPGSALAPPLAYLALNTLEAYLLTPAVMGHRFSLNPVIVFVSVFFWSWIWGVAGALMAVPILTTGQIVCNRIEKLSPLARMIER